VERDRQALRLQDPHADEFSRAGVTSFSVIASAAKQSILPLVEAWIASLRSQ
jgi:hypothetical protein